LISSAFGWHLHPIPCVRRRAAFGTSLTMCDSRLDSGVGWRAHLLPRSPNSLICLPQQTRRRRRPLEAGKPTMAEFISILTITSTLKLPQFHPIVWSKRRLGRGARTHDGEVNACRFPAKAGGGDAEGRFTKGRSGNRCGRLPGTRNKATVVAELLEKAAPIREQLQLCHESAADSLQIAQSVTIGSIFDCRCAASDQRPRKRL
jgi:hypothetical protein